MTQQAHEEIVDQIVSLASRMVQIPSRGNEDDCNEIVEYLARWMKSAKLEPEVMYGESGQAVGLIVRFESGKPGPNLCLDACLDTAPFGHEQLWAREPFAGTIENGKLHGRGAADSKSGAAIFANLAAQIRAMGGIPRGNLYFLFDADEHSGRFEGVRQFLDSISVKLDCVAIGYPGNYGLVVGSRGFLRGKITVHGVSSHSGARRITTMDNAINKMAVVVRAIAETELPIQRDAVFSFGPKVSVTQIAGGSGFSQIPDRCCCWFDFRLTPTVDANMARKWIDAVIERVDSEHHTPRKSLVEFLESWPAYRINEHVEFVRCLRLAATQELHKPLPLVVCGPSNIGNYLAAKGIPAIAGFGVTYENAHGVDESAEIDSIMPIYRSYASAITSYYASNHRRSTEREASE